MLRESLSGFERQSEEDQNDLVEMILEHRTGLTAIQKEAEELRALSNRLNYEVVELRDNGGRIAECLDDLSISSCAVQSAVLNLQTMGGQILQSNQAIHNLLLAIQPNIPSEQRQHDGEYIFFEDALGRTEELPYKFFRYYEVINISLLVCAGSHVEIGTRCLKVSSLLRFQTYLVSNWCSRDDTTS